MMACTDRIRRTGIEVKITSGQGVTSAATAAMNTGRTVACEDMGVRTQTISPEVFSSADRIAFVMRSARRFDEPA